MIVHKLEECPRGKQDLQRVVNQIKMREEFEALNNICRREHAGTVKCGTCAQNRAAAKRSAIQ